MTRSEFLPYVRRLADLMGLKDWTVEIVDEAPSNDAEASTVMVYGRKLARIRFSAKFLDDTPEGQRETVVHELTHLHLMPMDGVISDLLNEEHYRIYMRFMEYGIDGIAEAWAPHLPLPSHVRPAP